MALADFRLTRSGDVPLSFTGELLAEQAGKWFKGKERSQYFELRLHRTKGGKYVVERIYVSYWKGQSNYHQAYVAEDLTKAADILRKFDPKDIPGIGFPPGQQFEAKQEYLLSNLRQMYHERVSKILADFDVDEHVD